MPMRRISERLVRQKLEAPDKLDETIVVDGKWYWKSRGVCWTQPTDKSEPRKEIPEEEYREICSRAKHGISGIPKKSEEKTSPKDEEDSSISELRSRIDKLNFDDITSEGTEETIGDYDLYAWKNNSRDLGDYVNLEVQDKDGNVVAQIGDIQSQAQFHLAKRKFVDDIKYNTKLQSMSKEEISTTDGLKKRLSIVAEKWGSDVKVDKSGNSYISYNSPHGSGSSKFRAQVKDMTKVLEKSGFVKSIKFNKSSAANTEKVTYTHPETGAQILVKEYASRNSSKTSGYIQIIKNPD